MKNKKIIVLLLVLFLLTGCTKQMKDVNKKVITASNTNQVLIENILCQPEELREEYEKALEKQKKDYKKLYKSGDITKKDYKSKLENLLDLDELPKCTEISVIEGGYETFWTSVFVKPLAWLLVKLGELVKNYGLSIIIITLLIRMIIFPFMKGTFKQSENMKKAQPELNRLEKKYANKTDQQSMMAKSQEMMAIYKKYDIKLGSGCLFSFIQIPLFFAFYEALNRLPILFEGKFLCFHMGMTPLAALQTGSYIYLILPVIVGLVTYFSFKMNNTTTMTEDQAKQMSTMFNVMIIMIIVTSFSMSTAIIVYWITNSTFTIVQNLIMKGKK